MSLRYKSILREDYSQKVLKQSYQLFRGTTIAASKRRLSGTAPSPRFWVPPAYQGGAGTNKSCEHRGGIKKSPSRGDVKNRHDKGSRHSHPKIKKKRNQEVTTTALSTPNLDEEKKRFAEACNNILALSRQYKGHLARGSMSTPPFLIADEKPFTSSTSTTLLAKQLKNALHDIHSTEITLTWNHIMETELIFREMSAALQESILMPTCLAKEEKSLVKRIELADLAEFALSSLLSLRSERALLVKSVCNWSSKVTPPYSRKQNKSSSIKAWVATLFETAAANDASEMGSYTQALQMSGSFAHEDPSLGVSPNMFLAVVESISSTIPSFKLDGMTLDPHESSEIVNDVLNRLVNLLDTLPSPGAEHSELFAFVMAIFGSVGTLDSARNSFDYYRRYSHIIPFALVLNAYCEAAKREEDFELSRAIADECFNLVHQEWNDSLPGQPPDGVTHLCIALQCLFLAKGGTEVDVCDRVESLVARVMANEKYDIILSDVEANDILVPVEGPTLHLLDSLIKVLASCQDEERIRRAQKLLDVLLHSAGGERSTPTFPSTGACNQLLDAMGWIHRGQAQVVAEEIKRTDLEYAFNLLQFMQTKGKLFCWPTDATFQSIFRILSSVAPDDLGEKAESVLSNMEMRNPSSPTEPVCISLATYHRVIGCWVDAANKKGTSGKAFQRTMLLLEQMEIQSMPLLLTEKEIRTATLPSLYHTELQPTVRTYKLILGIFHTEATNAGGQISEESERLFFALVESMKLRGVLVSEPSVRKRVQNCVQLIKYDLDEKQRIQAFLGDLK